MAKRQVFFSFEYKKDVWRASQVRNMEFPKQKDIKK